MPGSRFPAHFALALLVGAFAVGCSAPMEQETIDCAEAQRCEQVNEAYKTEIETVVAQMNSCEVREDCTSIVPTLGCDEQATWLTTCAQGVRADQADAFRTAVSDLEPQFCDGCDLECHHDDERACTAPIAKCIEGRCVVEFAEDL